MKGQFGLLALAVIAHNVLAEDDCSKALEMQRLSTSNNYEYDLAYLNRVTDENYTKAKASASASIMKVFTGEGESFNESRRKYFGENRYDLGIRESEEVYRSYLDETQLQAWTECMRKSEQPIVRYVRTGGNVSAVQIEWIPKEALGTLYVHQPFNLDNAQLDPAPETIKEISGLRIIKVAAVDPSKSVSGALNGHTGNDSWWARLFRLANYRDRSAFIYIPAKPQYSSDGDIGPKKYVVPIEVGTVYVSWAYWSGKRWPDPPVGVAQEFPCLTTPPDMTYAQVTDLRPIHLPLKRRGKCVPNNSSEYCSTNSGAEYCTDLVVTNSCFVNTDWVEWYKWTAKRNNIPYTNEGYCQLPKKSQL
jgi:hypothetical protein